jgi:hypothetical protein
MSDRPPSTAAPSLSLSREERWTLHHVLLDRLRGGTPDAATGRPPTALRTAFERLDAGDTAFTAAELDAMETVLARYHHSPTWEVERPRLERLLHCVSTRRSDA